MLCLYVINVLRLHQVQNTLCFIVGIFCIVLFYIYCLSLSRCSAYRQVHGIQFLHSFLFSAFLFILPYDSTISSSSIPFHGHTCGTPLVSTGREFFAPFTLTGLRVVRIVRGLFLSCLCAIFLGTWISFEVRPNVPSSDDSFLRWFWLPLTTCIVAVGTWQS